MIRKYGATNDLLYSTKNSVTLEEELARFDDLFKQLMKVHNKYLSIEVNGNEKEKQNQWFDEIDECVPSFKHKVHNWLKDVALHSIHPPPPSLSAGGLNLQSNFQKGGIDRTSSFRGELLGKRG